MYNHLWKNEPYNIKKNQISKYTPEKIVEKPQLGEPERLERPADGVRAAGLHGYLSLGVESDKIANNIKTYISLSLSLSLYIYIYV